MANTQSKGNPKVEFFRAGDDFLPELKPLIMQENAHALENFAEICDEFLSRDNIQITKENFHFPRQKSRFRDVGFVTKFSKRRGKFVRQK